MWGTKEDRRRRFVYPKPIIWLQFNLVFRDLSVREGVFDNLAFFGVTCPNMKLCKVFHQFEETDALGLDLRQVREFRQFFLARRDRDFKIPLPLLIICLSVVRVFRRSRGFS